MVIDGNIRAGDVAIPSTALIRILNSDSLIAKTISIYDPYTGKFGVRLSTTDGIHEDERIHFRVVLSSTDSFLARVSAPVVFKGAPLPLPAPNVKVQIFRNHAPILRRTMPDTMVSENQNFRFRLVAIDLDGDTILYRLIKAPSTAKMDSITGLFTWQPSFEDSGAHEVAFSVHDGYDMAVSKVTTLKVKNVNRPPTFVTSLPDTAIREGSPLTFEVRSKDPDRDEMAYSQFGLPPGASFDSSSGLFQWTPTFEQRGEYILSLSVLDKSNARTSKTSRITVLNVNRPPVFTQFATDTSVAENDNLQLRFAAKDPDGDEVSLSMSSGPAEARISRDGVFFWKPTFLQAGFHDIVLQASDDSLKTNHTFNVHVMNSNRRPTPPKLLKPTSLDTVGLNNLRPLVFVWNTSSDEDADDTLRYILYIKGEVLDTSFSGIRDTVISVNVTSRLRAASVYSWWVSVSDGWMMVPAPETGKFRTSELVVQKEAPATFPKTFSLEHNYPNPFNPVTSIRYTIPERCFVRLTIWNMLGELVQELVSDEKDTGVYENSFKAENLPSGVYLVKLEAHPVSGLERKDFISTKKMILVK